MYASGSFFIVTYDENINVDLVGAAFNSSLATAIEVLLFNIRQSPIDKGLSNTYFDQLLQLYPISFC